MENPLMISLVIEGSIQPDDWRHANRSVPGCNLVDPFGKNHDGGRDRAARWSPRHLRGRQNVKEGRSMLMFTLFAAVRNGRRRQERRKGNRRNRSAQYRFRKLGSSSSSSRLHLDGTDRVHRDSTRDLFTSTTKKKIGPTDRRRVDGWRAARNWGKKRKAEWGNQSSDSARFRWNTGPRQDVPALCIFTNLHGPSPHRLLGS